MISMGLRAGWFGVLCSLLALLFGGCREEPPAARVSLHDAAATGDLACVRKLLSDGAEVDARDDLGRTPLHAAACLAWEPFVKVGEKSIVQLLLAAGANVDATDENGATPLHLAALLGRIKAAKQLLAGGANANAKDHRGATPLHKAVLSGSVELLERLTARGADANAVDQDGWTPAHAAAFYGHPEAYDFLVAHGADVSIRTNEGKTPADLAREAADQRVIVFSDGKDGPYAAIVTNPGEIAGFLLEYDGIGFDRVWVPGQEDVAWTGSVLRAALDNPAQLPAEEWFEHEYVRTRLHRYGCQYAGFIRNGRKYILSNMYLLDFMEEDASFFLSVSSPAAGDVPLPGNGFVMIADGGGIAVRALFDAETRTLVHIECNGR